MNIDFEYLNLLEQKKPKFIESGFEIEDSSFNKNLFDELFVLLVS